MSDAQLHRNEQANGGNLPQADSSQVYQQADPSQDNVHIHHNPDPPSYTDSVNHPTSQTQAPSRSSYTQAPSSSSYTRGPTDGSFPTAQPPRSLSIAARQQETPTTPSGQAQSANPYVQTSPTTSVSTAGNSPMDSMLQVFNKWGKMAEGVTGNFWNHLRTGPNVADTAMGRIAFGAKAMSEGGIEKVYRQTFDVAPDEHLLKTYACYLSTSTGPVAGTLYISSHKLAFCSDRPLAMAASSPQADPHNISTTPTGPSSSSATSPTSNKSPSSQHFYYRIMVPISQVQSVNPSENTEKKPTEKYVEVRTIDGHDFWFMGFVNYDKGVKNLQETVRNKDPSTGTIDANKLDRGNSFATTDANQMNRGTIPATSRHVPE